MKILYVANSRIPTTKAHGIQIFKMCESFVSAGNDVLLLLPTRHNDEFKKNTNPFTYYGVSHNFKIKKVRAVDPYWLIAITSGWYIKVQALIFMLSLTLYFLLMRKRAKYVVYTRDEYLLGLLQYFFKHVVWEGHALPAGTTRYQQKWLSCSAIVVLTKQLKNRLVELKISNNKILVAPDGVDGAQFKATVGRLDAREKLMLPEKKSIILYSGHLYPWKGAYVLAQAAKKLADNSLVVFVGGTTEDVVKLKEKVESKNILIIGHVPYGDIPSYLAAADVLVLPNSAQSDISKYYTSPMKLFEYMASGRVIVASDIPSIREVLNERTAILVKPDDSDALARGIAAALKDSVKASQLATAAQQAVVQYDWRERAHNIIHHISKNI